MYIHIYEINKIYDSYNHFYPKSSLPKIRDFQETTLRVLTALSGLIQTEVIPESIHLT